jgi:anti-sigma factor RsiW
MGRGSRKDRWREVHVRGEQLIAYIDGEADQAVKQHIEACNACAARAEPFIALQRVLLKAFYRLHCPQSQVLGEYYLGLLPEAEVVAIQVHLAECPYCPAELEDLRRFLAESGLSASGQWYIPHAHGGE